MILSHIIISWYRAPPQLISYHSGFKMMSTVHTELGSAFGGANENSYAIEAVGTEDAELSVENITKTVRESLLGTPHSGWRKFFYKIDPYAGSQYVRAPKKYNDANAIFTLIYLVGIILYCISAVDTYFNQKPVEKNSLVMAKALPPVYLNVSTTCGKKFTCANYTGSPGHWTLATQVTVSERWNKVDTASPCYGKSRVYNIPENANFAAMVCYSPDLNDGVTLQIPFRSSYTGQAYINVDIIGDPSKYSNDMRSAVMMEPTQHKTVYFNQVQYNYAGKPTEHQPYAAVCTSKLYETLKKTSSTSYDFPYSPGLLL